ncbi:MAG TPA: hypothetical protein VI365_27445 [Trebonia sp.]
MTDLAANKSHKDAGQDLVTGKEPVVADPRVKRLRAYWLSPTGLLIAIATILALGLRCAIFTQSSFLTSGSIEYDDGVYLGSAIRLLQGILPYKDYAFLQPPGILVVALPFAAIAKLASAKLAMAAARLATACAGAACVALAGNLVRHRGALVTGVTCGLLAVYPADIMAARTLLLEPWMNLCCLLAATAAFSAGRLAGPRRLALAGVALGFATTIKLWAAIPVAVLLAVILLVPGQRWARARWYVLAVAGGFLVPVAAFAGSVPLGFLRDTLLYQATRVGASTPMVVRLDHLTGLSVVLGAHGLAITPGSYTMFQADSTGSMEATSVGLALPLVVTIAAVALIVFPYARWRRDRSALEWFALATAVAAAAAILSYSAFFYHYPAFPAPWLAIAGGAAAGALAQALTTTERARRAVTAAVAVVVVAVAALEIIQVNGVYVQGNPYVADTIPAGACVVSDQVSVTISANRFTAAAPGCPDVVDSLAQTLALSHGVSPTGGAGKSQAVVSGWESIFSKAQFVWLTDGYQSRIPWTPQLNAWFHANFRLVRVFRKYTDSRLYAKSS